MAVESVIDWRRHPTIAFESDDWADAGTCPDEEARERLLSHPKVQRAAAERETFARQLRGTLETAADMRALFDVLERHRGGDGRPAVFTAMYATANPDYAAIRASNFEEYTDIFIDEGWPARWDGRGGLAAAREGLRRGVWYPEFHTRLHHCGPKAWLAILRGGHEETDVYRLLFDQEVYHFNIHLPEYDGMTINEQYEWLSGGVEAFRRALGREPRCAVNSDAIPGTEECWALLGIRVRSLRSMVLHSGKQVRPYGDRKPDGTMDGTSPMGRYNRFLDMVYLNRNAFFEVAHRGPDVIDDAFAAVEGCWGRGEPAVISTHRLGYCSLDADESREGLRRLDEFLGRFETERPETVCMTSREVAQLCRSGVSAAPYGDGWMLRNYLGEEAEARLPVASTASARDLRSGREFVPLRDRPAVYRLPPGDYRIPGEEAAPTE